MSKRLNIFLNRHFALITAMMFGAMAGLLMVFMPEWRFASLVDLLGIDKVVPGAQPPFGGTARKAAALAVGLVTVLATWPVIRSLERFLGKKPKPKAKKAVPEKTTIVMPPAPKVSAADAHPDAPPRRPIFAETELGAPLMSDEALSADGELILDARDQALDVQAVAVDPLPSAMAAPVSEPFEAAPVEAAPIPADAGVAEIRDESFATVVQTSDEPEDFSIDAMIVRLDSALRARSVRHQANPDAAAGIPGDIGSLRQALRKFGDAA